MKQLLIALPIVTLLAGAAGGFYGLRISPPGSAPAVAKEPAAAAEKPANETAAEPRPAIYDLPPIVTNLGSPPATWVRLEASVLYDAKASPHPEALGAQVTSDILAFMRTTSLTQLQGVIGLQNLKQDLNERVAIRSGGSFKEIVIRTLVIQ